ncbi:DUF7151 family protein [Stigmatella hybrida]|uniref:DUF7151 family protein n=1 Tax=Stigmatella hybrida TaxID=394097 RepID=UPI001CDAB6C8|nr:hypothetical protein [Stigmatella hybrida]
MPGTKVLLHLEAEVIGTNCYYGGTSVRTGIDTNGNGILETAEATQTEFVCSSAPPYATGWAASSPNGITSGLAPIGFWVPSGRKVTIFKASPSSQLKITVSDSLISGHLVNGGQSTYEVRMNGGRMSPACYQTQYTWNAMGWSTSFSFPFSTVCLTDQLPVGLYEFETWIFASTGQAGVGYGVSQPLVLVEELTQAANYGSSTSGSTFETTNTVFQRAPGRSVSYQKKTQTSLLKITLADTLRTGYNQNHGVGTVMVRIDNTNTACFTGKHNAQGTGSDIATPFVMTCILQGISSGNHTFSVWLRADSGGGTLLGWERSYPLLLVEELPNQNITYTQNTSASGEVGGDWSILSGRSLIHSISASGKTLRVTYSDTFRPTAGCNDYYGFYQLYIDGQPSRCINSQMAYNSAGTYQDHHHPINQVCLFKNLSQGPHSFAIASTTRQNNGTTCGTNHFGWNRGQPLLLIEELP